MTDTTIRWAVVTPMLAGLAWAGLVYATWMLTDPSGGNALAAMVTTMMTVALGIVGFILLSVPLVIGLTADTVETRLAAAWVGAVICALGGVFWLLGPDEQAATALVLFLPLAVAAKASRPS